MTTFDLTSQQLAQAVAHIPLTHPPPEHHHQPKRTTAESFSLNGRTLTYTKEHCACGASRQLFQNHTATAWNGGITMPQTPWQQAVWQTAELAVTETPNLLELKPDILQNLYQLIIGSPYGTEPTQKNLARIYGIVRYTARQLLDQLLEQPSQPAP